ncbi:MAG: hypothetical protein DLM60_21150 [Pseudonocardiales bacterium]|nr:caspase family protein [Actinomycetota bacterium]PZS13118.1 MAG: hypothetical protein DLM60_21150 [Pseudonocardiales bacterium]
MTRSRGAARSKATANLSNGTPRRRAFLVGINDYGNPRNNLNSCVADVHAFQQLLEDGYGFIEVKSLCDGDATLSNVRDGLDWLLSDTTTSDDRLVYFQSSHGHHLTVGDSIEQVLVVRSDGDKPYEFLRDKELSARTQSLPPGVLTIALDACYSGGMNKVLFTDEDISVARAKVWLEDDDQQLSNAKALDDGVVAFKLFGRKTTRSSAALASDWSLPVETKKSLTVLSKALDSNDVEVNGLLMAACQEGETAAAGTPQTNNLSAFTFALLSCIDRLGRDQPANELCDEADKLLKQLRMQQTPVVAEPPVPTGLGSRSFITMTDGLQNKSLGDTSSVFAAIGTAVQHSLADLKKGD